MAKRKSKGRARRVKERKTADQVVRRELLKIECVDVALHPRTFASFKFPDIDLGPQVARPVSWPARPKRRCYLKLDPKDGPTLAIDTVRAFTEHVMTKPYKPSEEPIPVLDGDEVVHRMPTCWTEDLVRHWLTEALTVERRIRARPHLYPARYKSCMPDVVRSKYEAYGADDPSPHEMTGQATKDDLALYDFVIPSWILMLDEVRDRKIVYGVALGLNLRAIGTIVGCSHEWARQRWAASAQIIVARLNERFARPAAQAATG